MLEDDTPVQKENWERLKEFDRKYGEKFGTIVGIFVLILMNVYVYYNKPEPECEMGTRYLEEDYPYCRQFVYPDDIKGHKFHKKNTMAPYPWNLCESALARHHRGLIYNGRMVSDFNHQYARDNWEIVPIDYEFEQKQYQIQQEEEYERNEEYAQKEFERRYELMTRKQAEEREKGWQHFFYHHYGMNEEEIEAWNKAGSGISEPSERVVDSRTSRQLEWETYINSKAGEDGLDIAEFDKALEEWNAKLVYPYTKDGENGLGRVELTEELWEEHIL